MIDVLARQHRAYAHIFPVRTMWVDTAVKPYITLNPIYPEDSITFNAVFEIVYKAHSIGFAIADLNKAFCIFYHRFIPYRTKKEAIRHSKLTHIYWDYGYPYGMPFPLEYPYDRGDCRGNIEFADAWFATFATLQQLITYHDNTFVFGLQREELRTCESDIQF